MPTAVRQILDNYKANEMTGNGNYKNLSKTYVKRFLKSLIFSGFKPFETTVRHVQTCPSVM